MDEQMAHPNLFQSGASRVVLEEEFLEIMKFMRLCKTVVTLTDLLQEYLFTGKSFNHYSAEVKLFQHLLRLISKHSLQFMSVFVEVLLKIGTTEIILQL